MVPVVIVTEPMSIVDGLLVISVLLMIAFLIWAGQAVIISTSEYADNKRKELKKKKIIATDSNSKIIPEKDYLNISKWNCITKRYED